MDNRICIGFSSSCAQRRSVATLVVVVLRGDSFLLEQWGSEDLAERGFFFTQDWQWDSSELFVTLYGCMEVCGGENNSTIKYIKFTVKFS